MKTLAAQSFLRRLAKFGIGIDPEYAADWPRNLSFIPDADARDYWRWPDLPRMRVHLIACLLEELGDWKELYWWQKYKTGLSGFAHSEGWLAIRGIARLLEVSTKTSDALVFRRREREAVIALLFCAMAFAEGPPHDVYLVPDTGDAILMLDHHEVIWAEFPSHKALRRFKRALLKKGFPVAQTKPDWTFKI